MFISASESQSNSKLDSLLRAASVENELLICCAQTQLNSNDRAQVEYLLKGKLDWNYLFSEASSHGVLPLLYQNLNSMDIDIPDASLRQLRNMYHSLTARNLSLANELVQIVKFLEKHSISSLPFKGPTLSMLAYGNLAFRQFDDIDILVHPRDFVRAKNLLLEYGFQLIEGNYFLNEEGEDRFARAQGEYSLAQQRGVLTIYVDLHSRLDSGYLFKLSADFSCFWKRLVSVPLLGCSVSTFCPDDLLIYLCIHGSKSSWKKLKWVCDIAELVKLHPNLDWELIQDRAYSLGAGRMLLLGLALAYEIFKIELPNDVIQKIERDTAIKSLCSRAKQRIFGILPPIPNRVFTFERFWFQFQSMERIQDRLLYLYRVLISKTLGHLERWVRPSKKDKDFFELPSNLASFYYLVRPIRLIKQFFETK